MTIFRYHFNPRLDFWPWGKFWSIFTELANLISKISYFSVILFYIIVFMDFFNSDLFGTFMSEIECDEFLWWGFWGILKFGSMAIFQNWGAIAFVVVLWLMIQVYSGSFTHGLLFHEFFGSFFYDWLALGWNLWVFSANFKFIFSPKHIFICNLVANLFGLWGFILFYELKFSGV